MAGAIPAETVVAVVGAGTMGAGIARVAAAAGHRVLLHDSAAGAVARALGELDVRLARDVERGRLSQSEAAALRSRIEDVPSIGAFGDAGLVVEAVVEDRDVKLEVLRLVEEVVAPGTILATNTSSLSVTSIAAGLARPQQLVGTHFFNPAPVMPLVEIVHGTATASTVADVAAATVAAWGKSPVHCASTPGFIVNRVARPFYLEALRLLTEGVADAATIDAIVTGAGGFPLGPFALMDLIGIDVNLAVSKSIYEQTFHDSRFTPSPMQQALVDAGRLGRKTGRGFYDHTSGVPAPRLAPPGPTPSEVVVPSFMAHEEALVARLERAGMRVRRADDDSFAIRVGDVSIHPTDGRPASMYPVDGEERRIVVMDAVLEWESAERVAIAADSRTDPDVVATAAGALQAAGLEVCVVDDAPGLVVARIVSQIVNVAADAALFGVAHPDDIDVAMRLGTNYPGGPFSWCDAGGSARWLGVTESLRWFYGEDRYRVSRLLRRSVYEGVAMRDLVRT